MLQHGSGAANACDAKSYGQQQFFLTIKLNKMQTQKMSLANIKGKLSRAEMKNIMAGSGSYLYSGGSCTGSVGTWIMTPPTSSNSCYADIQRYCRSGQGSCTFTN